MPLSELRKLTDAQLISRQLDDPQYAGFEENFNWKQYVRINIKDPALRAETVAYFEEMSATENGQQALRQSLAVHQQFIKQSPSRQHPAIPLLPTIEELPSNTITNILDPGSGMSAPGIIYIDKKQIGRDEIKGQDGEYHPLTLPQTLGHEIRHRADPIHLPMYAVYLEERRQQSAKASNDMLKPYIKDPKMLMTLSGIEKIIQSVPAETIAAIAKLKRDSEEVFSSIFEYTVIADTNEEHRHRGEAERALVHNDIRIGKPADKGATPSR